MKGGEVQMTRTNLKPTNRKSIECPDCGKWLTLQGYGGHRRFYHGEYERDLKGRLLNRLIALRQAGKISSADYEARIHYLGTYSKVTTDELLEVRDFLDIVV
jgi:hypothetical protein